MLLPSGEELLLLNPNLPRRWSDDLLGTGFVAIDSELAAAAGDTEAALQPHLSRSAPLRSPRMTRVQASRERDFQTW